MFTIRMGVPEMEGSWDILRMDRDREKSRSVYKHKLAHFPDTCYNHFAMAGDLRIAHDTLNTTQ